MLLKNYPIPFSLLLSLLFLCTTAAAQLLPGMRKFNNIDGYDATVGYNLSQDADGCIWMGTDNGVFRFDGTSFMPVNRENGLLDIDILDCVPYAKGSVLLSPLLNNIACYTNHRTINNLQDKKLNVNNRLKNKIFNDANSNLAWLTDNALTDTLYQFSDSEIHKISLGYKDVGIDYLSAQKAFGHFPSNRLIALSLKDKTLTYLSFTGKKKRSPTQL